MYKNNTPLVLGWGDGKGGEKPKIFLLVLNENDAEMNLNHFLYYQ